MPLASFGITARGRLYAAGAQLVSPIALFGGLAQTANSGVLEMVGRTCALKSVRRAKVISGGVCSCALVSPSVRQAGVRSVLFVAVYPRGFQPIEVYRSL